MTDIKVTLNLLMALLFGALSLLIFFKGVDKRKSRVFLIFVFNMVLWAFGLSMFYLKNSPSEELFWAKFVYMAGGLIPPSFLCYSLIFNHSDSLKLNFKTLFVVFVPNFFLFYFYFFTPLMITGITQVDGFKTFQFGPLHLIWEVTFTAVFTLGFLRFLNLYKQTTGLIKEHIRYIFFGTLVGVLLASVSNVILPFFGNCRFVWLGPALTSTWLMCITYTILKHKIIDVRLGITNIGSFLLVYTFGLGAPLYIYFTGHKLIALIVMGICGPVIPVIFNSLKKRAEDTFLEEQRKYQNTLKESSKQINKLKTKEEIAERIVSVVCDAMSLKNGAIYTKDEDKYVLIKKIGENNHFINEITLEEPLIKYITSKGVFLVEEFEHKSKKIQESSEVLSFLKERIGSVIVPIVHDEKLLGLLLLGEKINHSFFAESDLNALDIISVNTALAIENATYLQIENKRMEEEGAISRRANLDTMVSTMSHQIASPLNTVKVANACMEEVLSEDTTVDPNVKEMLLDQLKVSNEVVSDISTIIQSVKDYSRGQIVYENILVDQLLKSFLPIKNGIISEHSGCEYLEDISTDLPFVYGDQSMIKEILVIYLNNSYQSLDGWDGVKKVKLSVYRFNGNYVRFEVSDTGKGIKNEVKKKLFETVYTTKPAGRGLGIGLGRVVTVCRLMDAKYGFDSEGEGKGARFWVDIKIVKG